MYVIAGTVQDIVITPLYFKSLRACDKAVDHFKKAFAGIPLNLTIKRVIE
jgi:hypothetical protein